jgi:hypothetical protein
VQNIYNIFTHIFVLLLELIVNLVGNTFYTGKLTFIFEFFSSRSEERGRKRETKKERQGQVRTIPVKTEDHDSER